MFTFSAQLFLNTHKSTKNHIIVMCPGKVNSFVYILRKADGIIGIDGSLIHDIKNDKIKIKQICKMLMVRVQKLENLQILFPWGGGGGQNSPKCSDFWNQYMINVPGTNFHGIRYNGLRDMDQDSRLDKVMYKGGCTPKKEEQFNISNMIIFCHLRISTQIIQHICQ